MGLTAELQDRTPPARHAPLRDQHAFIRDLQRRLRPAIRKICPSDLAAHTDDLVQLAVLRVLHAMPEDDQGEGAEPLPTSYLRKVAYTTTIDELRKVRSQQNTRGQAAQAQAQAVEPTATPSPESAAHGAQIGTAIRGCIERLDTDRRRAVVLHLQGHSVPEAASLLGWVRKRTENLVYRGMADLRRCLASKGFQP